MKCNNAGLNLIKQFEGERLQAYQDQKGLWTIGVGHLGATPGEVITEGQADDLLRQDLAHVETCIADWTWVPLTSNQFSALCSLVFNIGTGAYYASTLHKLLLNKQYEAAASEFLKWNHINGVVSEGLTRRREAERTLYLTPDQDMS